VPISIVIQNRADAALLRKQRVAAVAEQVQIERLAGLLLAGRGACREAMRRPDAGFPFPLVVALPANGVATQGSEAVTVWGSEGVGE
jgi:hypothetical protein